VTYQLNIFLLFAFPLVVSNITHLKSPYFLLGAWDKIEFW
jgi:hypothetical protein